MGGIGILRQIGCCMDSSLTLIILILLIVAILVLVALLVIRRRRAAADSQEVDQKKSKRPEKNRQNKQAPSKARAKSKVKAKKQQKGSLKPTAPADNKILSSTQPAAGSISRIAPPPQAHAPAGEKIRILIVDDNTGTRENVSRLLFFEDDLEVIGQAVNGRQGVEMAADIKPHIVLMDINMPDMDGITATQQMSVKAPFSQVIIMSVQNDQHYMKRAMAAGARDFQPKPFTSEELVGCIRRVYAIGMPVFQQFEMMEQSKNQPAQSKVKVDGEDESTTPVIVVYSPKGGVGTSAVAINLAVALHQARGDAVLMDCDLQVGDIAVHLNTRPERTISDMVHEGSLEADLLPDVVAAHNSGLKLLLAPVQPEQADIFNGKLISGVISAAKSAFQLVVIDTASKLHDTSLAILERADYVLVVTNPEVTSMKSTKLFLELAERLGYDMDRVGVVVNRATMPAGIPIKKIKEVLRLDEIYEIPDDPKLHFALTRGNAICLTEPSAPSASAINTVAREILAQLPVPDPVVE
jgi:pilus assembly protein CpaE